MTLSPSLDRVQPRAPPIGALGELPITVLMNMHSGRKDKAAARHAIDNVLKSAGRDVELLLARHPRELPLLARMAAAARPGILAAAGGDGTLNAVAAAAHACALPLALIPLGTFNYFARELDIPLDSAAAARVIVEGRVRRVPIGQVNGRLFLNNASIGLYRRLIERREWHKRRFGRNRLVALLSALLTVLRRQRPYQLRLEIDDRPVALSTLTVFFGRNALQMEQMGLDEALCVRRGEMAVLALPEAGRLELLVLGLRGALARLETAPALRQYCASRVKVERLERGAQRIRVALDGEVVDCRLPLLFEAVPEALQVIVPAAPERGG